ncbi:MAG TPA: hypothetical protein VGG57_13880 [Stellaceae bacterium]|jgi:hypothetical protein
MSSLLIAAGIAVGTPVALLSLAYFAALSAYRAQALQDEELARVWNRVPARARPAAGVVTPAASRRRPPLPATCVVVGNAAAQPRRQRAPRRAAR